MPLLGKKIARRKLLSHAPAFPCGMAGENRNAIAIRFHALIVPTAEVRNTTSFSSNSFDTAAYA